jgi:hypothetical protein
MRQRILHHPFFIKLLHWEYWPFPFVYGPILLYWFFLCLRTRSFFFFNTSNPFIYNGGFMMESKKSIYDLIPEGHYPYTVLCKAHTGIEEVLAMIKKEKLQYPLIAKPDIGMKGLSVKKVNNERELIGYILHSKVNYLIQEFVSYEKEVGVFYYRYPGEAKGHISGIVQKELLTVKGDGISTITDLLRQDKRFILQLPVLQRAYGAKLNTILKEGEEYILVPYGNHARGAKFIDISYLIDEKLVNKIDEVCSKVKGFYYGRLDIKYNTWEELKQGIFSIIELNGAGSEPTHIYDPGHSIFYAWKEIIKHWNILFHISRMNHRLLKQPYMNVFQGVKMLRANRDYTRLISE